MMSNRGIALLAVGMLVLGLLLGGLSGGAAGYFMGRGNARAFGGAFNQPSSPNFPNQNQPGNPNSPNNFPQRGLGQGGVTGARVIDVEANSAADKAGLKVDDVITAVAGTKIDDTHALADLVKAHKPGESLVLSVNRGTQTVSVTIQLGASPTDTNAAYLGIHYAPVASQSQGGRRFQ